MDRIAEITGPGAKPQVAVAGEALPLEAGDLARVKSKEEIESTFNDWRQLRGRIFMPKMPIDCGTLQRVLKSVERFVDERDLHVKRTLGIVPLGVCQGTAYFGPCDRSCCF